MWGSLRFRIAILVLASLDVVVVSLVSTSIMSDSTGTVLFPARIATLVLGVLVVLVLALSYLSLRQFVVPLRVLA